MEYDKLFIKILNKRNRKRLSVKKHKNIIAYLTNKFNNTKNWCEGLYRLYNNLINKPTCKVCDAPVKFINFNVGYRQYCSVRCKCIENGNKVAKTKLVKYGDSKYNNTDKTKTTKLNRYGDSTYNNILKRKQTCLEKYGVDNVSKCKEIKQKLINKQNSEEVKIKIYQTKKNNNSFRNTKPEQEIYNTLLTKYNYVKREYKSKEYPFSCDFYIPALDLYIEYNGYWTHGYHKFDINNLNDLTTLEIWKKQAETKKQYQNAIDTWTKRDINKFIIAEQNNLNYLVFYNLTEFYSWFNDICK